MKTKDGRECNHDESWGEDCAICDEVQADEERYWFAYFGGSAGIKARIAEEKFQREEYGCTYDEMDAEKRQEVLLREKGR